MVTGTPSSFQQRTELRKAEASSPRDLVKAAFELHQPRTILGKSLIVSLPSRILGKARFETNAMHDLCGTTDGKGTC